MNQYRQYEDIAHSPEAEAHPFRLALHWLIEGCLRVLESWLDRLELFETWVMKHNYERIATRCVAFVLASAALYITYLIACAVAYVIYVPMAGSR